MDHALLQMQGLRREFPAGDTTVAVLKDIDLTIEAGEMVAIVGASGSGKSTLMNILGCLDHPTSGSYRIAGRETSELGPDALAALREHFGFIFQRYHLLPDLTAQGNVELPSVYAGTAPTDRHARSAALLERLGLADRMQHRPGQLSGGQQQRVSIARALMNGGAVILADEPTGALDKASGEQVMRILQELHADGHHHPGHARHGRRRPRHARDRDQRRCHHCRPAQHPHEARPPVEPASGARRASWRGLSDRFGEALRMALRAMNAHRLRTFLTMLGIIIGISAVVSVVALGLGAQQQVMNQISELGTNTLDIFPGKDFGDTRAAAIETLVAADAQALAEQPYVDSATPNVSVGVTALYRENAATAQVTGVGFELSRARPAPGIGPLLRPARRGPARPGGGDRPEDRHRPVPHQPQPAGRGRAAGPDARGNRRRAPACAKQLRRLHAHLLRALHRSRHAPGRQVPPGQHHAAHQDAVPAEIAQRPPPAC